KYVKYPFNLDLTCRGWSSIAKDPQVRSEWLIAHYGKEHALFHAVRLGPTFINDAVCDALFKKSVIISEYFISKLLMNFGMRDQRLIQFRIRYDVRRSISVSSWGSNLPMGIFKLLVEKGYDNANKDLSLRERDIKLFDDWNIGD